MYEIWIMTTEGKVLLGWITRAVMMVSQSTRIEGEMKLVINKQHKIPEQEMIPTRDWLVKVA